MRKITLKQNKKGFTIVELLVVIVVIGILAGITLVAFGQVTSRANTSSGLSDAGTFLTKMHTFDTELAVTVPTTYASITSALNTKLYFGTGYNFTPTSSLSSANPGLMTQFRPAGISNDALDFQLCGTGTAGAVTMYSAITVPTGVKIGYWDYVAGSENNTLFIGQTSGNWTNGYNITCYKVGIAEAAMAVVMASKLEAGNWPATAAAVQSYASTTGDVLPTGLNILGAAAGAGLTTGNGLLNVDYNCKSSNCVTNGGRIMYWDYSTGGNGTLSTGATSIYFGGAISTDTFNAA
jgi:prepilin-type N-terminal cleavage/methylation domain-containing protein